MLCSELLCITMPWKLHVKCERSAWDFVCLYFWILAEARQTNKRALLILPVVLRVSPVLHSKEAFSVLRVLGAGKGLDVTLVHTLFYSAFSVGCTEWRGWVHQQMILSSSFGLRRGDFPCLCKENEVQTVNPEKAVSHCHSKAWALRGVFKREQNLGYCKMRKSIGDLWCSKKIFYLYY